MTTTAVNVYRHRHAARTPYIDRELMSEETCPYPIGHAAGLRLSHSGSLPQRATVDGPWGKPGCTRLGRHERISGRGGSACVRSLVLMPRPDGFEYVERGDDVVIIHRGKPATTLRGAKAAAFLEDVEQEDPQELMARLTGNYRRGNERQARNHPRNRGR